MSTVVRIDDRIWRRVRQQIAASAAAKVNVGVLGDGELALIAACHEYGTRTIPERSFIRSTLRERGRKDIAAFMAGTVTRFVNGEISVQTMYDLNGQYIASAIRDKIRSNIPPPLAPATIARKGSSLALVDTGRMINAIRHETVTK